MPPPPEARSARAPDSEAAAPPDYAGELTAFHLAFFNELRAVVGALPLQPQMRVLDAGCGDGFYTALLAQRLASPGGVVGLDLNPAYLAQARDHVARHEPGCEVTFVQGQLSDVPLKADQFDVVWCAQSLYSLPEPVSAIRQMSHMLRAGGLVVVLENDSMHQLLLPWPPKLEIALRSAEYRALTQETSRPSKYYVGRRLPQVFAAAGLEPLGFRTQCIDRQAPLDRHLEEFLAAYLQRLAERSGPQMPAELAEEFAALVDPADPAYLPRQPHFTLSWVNVLAWARKPSAG